MSVALQQDLQTFCGFPLAMGQADLHADPPPLLPEETAAVINAVPKRKAEFAAGRDAARQAMAQLGWTAHAIPADRETRAPIWPNGLTGSITHSDRICMAVVTQTGWHIGIDAEPATLLDTDLWDIVLTDVEKEWVASTDASLAIKIFSAKEAAYKAQFPLSQHVFDFQTLEIHPMNGGLTAKFQRDVGPFREGDQLHGMQTMYMDHILSFFIAPAIQNGTRA